jgi:inorganic pyrophosphatase
MDVKKIPVGDNPPWDVNVIIEVSLGSDPVKYEFDKDSGAIFVVVGRVPVVPGAIVRSRPVGVLMMEDEAGIDEKILAVPVDALHPYYANVVSYRDLPEVLRDQIAHFFAHYKDLEKDKWVNVTRWGEADEATRLIEEAIARAGSADNGAGAR